MRTKKALILFSIFLIFTSFILTGCDRAQTETLNVTELNLQEEYIVIKMGESEALVARVYPFNANNKGLSWSSSDVNIATVNKGVVTGSGVGSAQIFVESKNGKYKDMCYVDVIN